MESLENLACQFAGNWKNKDFAWRNKPDHPDTWGHYVIETRDSNCLDQSNAAYITRWVSQYSETLVCIERHSHWAYGWIKVVTIRVYAPFSGKIMPVFARFCDDILTKYDHYPVLDEQDYSAREYEAQCVNVDNVDNAIKSYAYHHSLQGISAQRIAQYVLEHCNEWGEEYWPEDNEIRQAIIAIRKPYRKANREVRYWCATVHSAGCVPDDPDSSGYFKGFGLAGKRAAIEYLADSQDLSKRMIKDLRKRGIAYFNAHEHDLYLCEIDEISESDYLENCDQDN